MSEAKRDQLLTASQVANRLNISVVTLTNWYKGVNHPDFEKPNDMPELPNYEQAGARQTRFWKEADIPKLEAFKEYLPHGRGGILGVHNSQYWGDRDPRKKKPVEEKVEA